jgi:hypothetical protein
MGRIRMLSSRRFGSRANESGSGVIGSRDAVLKDSGNMRGGSVTEMASFTNKQVQARLTSVERGSRCARRVPREPRCCCMLPKPDGRMKVSRA